MRHLANAMPNTSFGMRLPQLECAVLPLSQRFREFDGGGGSWAFRRLAKIALLRGRRGPPLSPAGLLTGLNVFSLSMSCMILRLDGPCKLDYTTHMLKDRPPAALPQGATATSRSCHQLHTDWRKACVRGRADSEQALPEGNRPNRRARLLTAPQLARVGPTRHPTSMISFRNGALKVPSVMYFTVSDTVSGGFACESGLLGPQQTCDGKARHREKLGGPRSGSIFSHNVASTKRNVENKLGSQPYKATNRMTLQNKPAYTIRPKPNQPECGRRKAQT